jgi:hypothetical protein
MISTKKVVIRYKNGKEILNLNLKEKKVTQELESVNDWILGKGENEVLVCFAFSLSDLSNEAYTRFNRALRQAAVSGRRLVIWNEVSKDWVLVRI